jgi:hypothetical protein
MFKIQHKKQGVHVLDFFLSFLKKDEERKGP